MQGLGLGLNYITSFYVYLKKTLELSLKPVYVTFLFRKDCKKCRIFYHLFNYLIKPMV
jgi:hypothetical protein